MSTPQRTLILGRRIAAAALALALAGCAVGSSDADYDEVTDGITSQSSRRPASDVETSNVEGIGDTTHLFHDVDDGTNFTVADDLASYVRTSPGRVDAFHTVGFANMPTGAVSQILVNYRAGRGTAHGTAQAILLDGDTIVARGEVRQLGAWANYTDTF
jgi:hypothetical protein